MFNQLSMFNDSKIFLVNHNGNIKKYKAKAFYIFVTITICYWTMLFKCFEMCLEMTPVVRSISSP